MQFNKNPENSNSQLLERFFTGLSEYAFYSHLGVTDTELVAYISGLLVRFTKTESLLQIRRWHASSATEIVALLTVAHQQEGRERREIHRHIGDFTLFWTGLYPESLKGSSAGQVDRFKAFRNEGKRAYEIASEIPTDSNETPDPPNELLHRLSESFDLCAEGLREIRRLWEEPPNNTSIVL